MFYCIRSYGPNVTFNRCSGDIQQANSTKDRKVNSTTRNVGGYLLTDASLLIQLSYPGQA